VDDHHKFSEERPPEDVVAPNIEAGYLKRQFLLALIVPYSTRQLQIDASNGSGRLPWDDPMKHIMYRGSSLSD
jgi:hypothetical protein